MAQKTHRSLPGPRLDIGTDHALMVTAAGAALLALIYLILV
jgi:hypothetical protein